MKRTFLLLLCSSFMSTLSAQVFDSLDANNINAGFRAGTSFFVRDSINYSLYEVPKGSRVSSIFASSLWLSGLDAGGNLKGAGNTYGPTMYVGPIASSYGTAFTNKYNRVWKVTRDEIHYHQAHYTDAGYSILSHIADWPGNGNTANGEATILAPFIDVNGNGIYEPLSGDYPDICGDQNIFMMLNDDGPGTQGFACAPMNIEMHILAYSFVSPDTPLCNTVFFKCNVFNRSAADYHALRFSNFVDPDLGCSENDRLGCDSILSMGYVYNDQWQKDYGPACLTGHIGYGFYTKVAQGFTFLSHRMSGFDFFSRINMPPGDSCGAMIQSQKGTFVFPGDPTDSMQMSELYPHLGGPPIPAGDRRFVSTVSIDSLKAGGSFTVDMAYVTSFADSSAPQLGEIRKLKQDVATIRQMYAQGQTCKATIAGIHDIASDLIAVYPNPAKDMITVNADAALLKSSYTLTDMTGRLITSGKIENTSTAISLSGIASGVYLLQAGGHSYKVVKE